MTAVKRDVPSFVERWPALERRLHRALVSMRVPEAWRDDVVQETSMRLFRVWDGIDHARPLWPIVRLMAERSAIDEARRNRNAHPVEEVPELWSEAAESVAIRRIETARVRDALGLLSPRDRQILLSEINEAEPPVLGASALKMGRMRARRRLRALLGDFEPAFALVPLRHLYARIWVRLAPKAETSRSDWLTALTAGTNLILAAGVVILLGAQGTPAAAPDPSSGSHAFVPPTDHRPPRPPRPGTTSPLRSEAGETTAAADNDPIDQVVPDSEAGTGVGAMGAQAYVFHEEEGNWLEVCIDPEPGKKCEESETQLIVYVDPI